MKVIIRIGNGKSYVSKVFGILNNKINDKKESTYNWKYIVFDEKHEKLIAKKVYELIGEKKYINKQILIIDNDYSDLNLDENGVGKIEFLTNEDVDNIINNKEIRKEIIEKCKQYLFEFDVNDFIDVNNQKDIDNLLVVSGYFHDAYIDKIEKNNDESIRVLFDGIWGCKIEIIFEGNVAYNDTFKAPYEVSEVWESCNLSIIDNFYVLVSDYEYDTNKLDDSFPWFKSRKMKYRILPE